MNAVPFHRSCLQETLAPEMGNIWAAKAPRGSLDTGEREIWNAEVQAVYCNSEPDGFVKTVGGRVAKTESALQLSSAQRK